MIIKLIKKIYWFSVLFVKHLILLFYVFVLSGEILAISGYVPEGKCESGGLQVHYGIFY